MITDCWWQIYFLSALFSSVHPQSTDNSEKGRKINFLFLIQFTLRLISLPHYPCALAIRGGMLLLMRHRIWEESNFHPIMLRGAKQNAEAKRRSRPNTQHRKFDDKSTCLPSTNINGSKLFTSLSSLALNSHRHEPLVPFPPPPSISLRPGSFFDGHRVRPRKRRSGKAAANKEEQTSATRPNRGGERKWCQFTFGFAIGILLS